MQSLQRNLLFLGLLPASILAAWGQSLVEQHLEAKTVERIRSYDASLAGVLGVAAIDLTNGHAFSYHGDAVFPTASSIKIAIMAEMFRAARRGQFQLSDSITIQPAESAGGSGELQKALAGGPVRITLRDLITAMIEHSDNTATNRCISMAGMDRVNRFIEDLGFHTIRLRRIMMDSAAAARGDENTASPLEMARLVESLQRGRMGDAVDTRQMIDTLKLVRADIRAVIPAGIEVASKPGDLTGVECEVAIVYLPRRPFIMSVYSTFLDDETHPVRDIARIVYEHFAKLAASNEYGNRVY